MLCSVAGNLTNPHKLFPRSAALSLSLVGRSQKKQCVTYHRIPKTSTSPPWKPQISHIHGHTAPQSLPSCMCSPVTTSQVTHCHEPFVWISCNWHACFHIVKFPIRVIPTCWHKKNSSDFIIQKLCVGHISISIQSESQERLQVYIHQATH